MMQRPISHPETPAPKVGVLLINLGTPESAEPRSVKRYLREFLSDRRVVEMPPLIWQPILRGIILNTRPRRSARAYSRVWTSDGSPLAVVTRQQAEKIQASIGGTVLVDWAMRYGTPSIADKLNAMKQAGCDRILLASLYPQYSGATTATGFDEVARVLGTMRWQPAIRTLPPYFDAPDYISALNVSIESSVNGLNFEPDAIVASFHSMPERTLTLGDPYHCHCQKTARLLSEALGRELIISFQSRLGRAKWLGPATDATLASLPARGIKKIAVVTPGFAADNLETLDEIAIEGKGIFLEAGGEEFAFLPCLNASSVGVDMLKSLILRELSGWL